MGGVKNSVDPDQMLPSSLFDLALCIVCTCTSVPAFRVLNITLRKHAYSNTLIILQPKKENFQIKKIYIFHIPAQNTDCGYLLESPRRGGSNEYPQSMFF